MAKEIEIRVGKKGEMGNRKRVGEKKGKKEAEQSETCLFE